MPDAKPVAVVNEELQDKIKSSKISLTKHKAVDDVIFNVVAGCRNIARKIPIICRQWVRKCL